MADSETYTTFNVRNVTQKEIYDSYMGILRISPNKIQGKDVDDPTSLLNTLVDFDGKFGDKNLHTTITLSDSDGNVLPIYFIPKAFNTEVIVNTYGDKELRPIINMVSKIDGYTYVSNTLTSRSTILIPKKDEISANPDKTSNIVFALDCNKNSNDNSIVCKQILTYPIEAPNDDDFFNNKNKLSLFDPTSTVPRDEQMEEALLAKDKNWFHKNHLTYETTDVTGVQQQVVVNNKAITYLNNLNEDIPVLYTRDYVLGHYDGHSLSKNHYDKRKKQWINDGTNLILDDDGRGTRLSWLRVDDIMWEMLDEILKGNERHEDGRYSGLGINGNDSICTNLFGTEVPELSQRAPLLGQGVQDGIVMYHAMPFSRYWFHRCRQVVNNMNYWKQQYAEKSGGLELKWEQYPNCTQQEMRALQSAFTDNKITPACDSTISKHHSLSKDFVLCDNKNVTFANYPNISLKNDKILHTPKSGLKATLSEGKTDFTPNQNITGVHALIKTTPDLFVFDEKYPRFIRSLNWSTGNKDWDADPDETQSIDISNTTYYNGVQKNNTTRYVHAPVLSEVIENDVYDVTYNNDYHGNPAIDIQKNITETKLHPYTFEYLIEAFPHKHKLFSNYQGGQGKEDYSKKIVQHFIRYNGDMSMDASNCLWENPYDFYITRGRNWANYCLRNGATYFDNYTPVPNMGFMLFNSHAYNPWRKHLGYVSAGGFKYRGTIKDYEEKGWASSGFGYYDAENQWHTINNSFNIKTPIPSSSTEVSNAIATAHKAEKFKRRQLAMKLNESEARLPISRAGKAQFANYSHHVFFWKKKSKWWKAVLMAVLAVAIVVVAVVTCQGYIAAGLGGLFGAAGVGWGLTIAGATIAGMLGGAVFGGLAACFGWGGNFWEYVLMGGLGVLLSAGAVFGAGLLLSSWACLALPVGIYTFCKNYGSKWPSAQGHGARSNIGRYTFGSFNQNLIEQTVNTTDKFKWKCLTSLPYTDTEYLAVGEIEKLNKNNIQTYKDMTFEQGRQYYIAHNVTDKWNAFKTQAKDPKDSYFYDRLQHYVPLNYQGETQYADIDGPHPSYMNFTPLIKL